MQWPPKTTSSRFFARGPGRARATAPDRAVDSGLSTAGGTSEKLLLRSGTTKSGTNKSRVFNPKKNNFRDFKSNSSKLSDRRVEFAAQNRCSKRRRRITNFQSYKNRFSHSYPAFTASRSPSSLSSKLEFNYKRPRRFIGSRRLQARICRDTPPNKPNSSTSFFGPRLGQDRVRDTKPTRKRGAPGSRQLGSNLFLVSKRGESYRPVLNLLNSHPFLSYTPRLG